MSLEKMILRVCLTVFAAVVFLRLSGHLKFGNIPPRERNLMSQKNNQEGALLAGILGITILLCMIAGYIWINWF